MTSNSINKILNHRAFFTISLALTGFLLACKPQQKLANDMQTYQQRLASVLDQAEPHFSEVLLPPYPPLTELRQNTPETAIKLSEFYQLQHCQLASIIAERNTTLGKLHLPSVRFTYEKKLIKGLQACISDTDEPQLKSKLQVWLTRKNQSLNNAWADMLQTSTEIKQGMSANSGFIVGEQQDGLGQTLSTLAYLTHSLHSPAISSNELENHLQDFARSALLAKLWRSQLLLTVNLETTTTWLQQQTLSEMCSNPSPKMKQKIDYLTNVFQLFFIEKIQPVASQINHYHYQLNPKLGLLMQNPALSTAYKNYIEQQHYLQFSDYQSAIKQHIEEWQKFFKQCNLRPGKR